MSEKTQGLVLAIIDFLNQSIADGTVKEDDKEGLEVAGKLYYSLSQQTFNDASPTQVQCIGEAFGVDPSNEEQVKRLSIKQPSTIQATGLSSRRKPAIL